MAKDEDIEMEEDAYDEILTRKSRGNLDGGRKFPFKLTISIDNESVKRFAEAYKRKNRLSTDAMLFTDLVSQVKEFNRERLPSRAEMRAIEFD